MQSLNCSDSLKARISGSVGIDLLNGGGGGFAKPFVRALSRL
jgi:hypothetical protein